MWSFIRLSGVLSLLIAAQGVADEPAKRPNKPVAITKEDLIGQWKGPDKCPVTLIEFTKEKVKLTVAATTGGQRKSATVEWDYKIDASKKYVLLHPLEFEVRTSLAGAELMADGTLSVVFAAVPPVIPIQNDDKELKKSIQGEHTFSRVKGHKVKE